MGQAAPTVEITLDKPRHMQFTFGVAKKFKDKTGKDITELDAEMSFDEIATMLWLTLAVEDPSLTQEQADDLFHVGNVKEYGEKLLELIDISTPENDDPKATAGR